MKSCCILLLLLIPFLGQSQNVNVSNGNIFDGEPYLAIEEFDHLESCELIDANGEHIQTITSATTNVEALPSGTYFVHFTSNGKTFAQSFVINQ